MKYPIKVLKDKDQNPFIPFVTTSSVVENGTNRNLDDILHNLTVPIANLNSLENTAVADMMTNMKDYKDSGFAIIYVNTDNTGLLLAFEKITTVDVLNKCWSFVSSFNADSKAYRINITGYYNADNSVFTVSSATIEELKQKSSSNIYELTVQYASPSWFSFIPKQDCTDVINKIIQDGVKNPVIRLVTTTHHSDYKEQAYFDFIYCSDKGPMSSTRNYYYFVCYGYVTVRGAPVRPEVMDINYSVLTISGTWTDGVFTCTNVSGHSYFDTSLSKLALTDNVLTKTNTTAFTPTENYHPATKKYVDASINKIPTTQDLVDNGFSYDTPGVQFDATENVDKFNKKKMTYVQREVEFDKSELYSRYEFGWSDDVTDSMGNLHVDIKNAYIKKDNKSEINISGFCPDVDYMLFMPSDFSMDGFALLMANSSKKVPIKQ